MTQHPHNRRERLLAGWMGCESAGPTEWDHPQQPGEGNGGPEQTGTTGTTKRGPRDVDDVSWALSKFFFFSISFFRY
jgi:hypothetical protein